MGLHLNKVLKHAEHCNKVLGRALLANVFGIVGYRFDLVDEVTQNRVKYALEYASGDHLFLFAVGEHLDELEVGDEHVERLLDGAHKLFTIGCLELLVGVAVEASAAAAAARRLAQAA